MTTYAYVRWLLIALLLQLGALVIICQTGNDSTQDYSKSWKTVTLKDLTISLPGPFKQVEVHCIEGGCYRFEADSMVVKIDMNIDAGHPTFERSGASYAESFEKIDGKSAWLWKFEDDGEYKFNYGVKFNLLKRSRKYDVGCYFFSKRSDVSEMATRVFRSIRFSKSAHVR